MANPAVKYGEFCAGLSNIKTELEGGFLV